ncbi:LuxR C-terminal-related transcriptional regulator [Flavobacterium sediminilitoris]|uniref:LuxR C-terminal-related transcriptional regulator n=1 Tax=Flavobacterium sediminilitoris TaxID=2024526 RepID=A0ABY4HLP1_9FLAO|nr:MULTISPECIES: LuxR C-terminal-related transcriptional regulator [Flavobacterium]UOX32394.1 LuxR C-terminal-related transcriptional regulator [Flavobacterium sediminilitoris]
MNDKFKTSQLIHQIPAGLLVGDNSTELFACRETKKVYALSNGKTMPFEKLEPKKISLLFEKLLDDEKALNDLKHLSQQEAIEQFAFCIYGAADHFPDFDLNGNLSEADNFICSNDCQCLKWKSKTITVDGQKLTPRQIQIIQLLASDYPDKQIADTLSISESTLNTHKAQLFSKFSVSSKTGLIKKAIEQKIIQ